MPSFTKVNPGDPIQSHQLNQVIDALIGTAGQGVPLAPTAVNDATNYALTVQNDESGNSRALNVLKSDGTTLIKADASGVTLGSPLNLPANSITSAAIADAGIQNVDLGPDVARENLLTNGSFDVWQRGAGPFSGALSGTADRWQSIVGAGTLSVSKDTTNVDTGSLACAAVTNTNTTAGQTYLQQFLTNTDGYSLRGRTLSASVRVRTATANAVRIGLGDDQTAPTYSAYHSGGGTYQTLTVTFTAASNETLFFLRIYFDASCTAYLDNACLVVGSQPANYVPLHPADDLARCLRYYELVAPSSAGIYQSFPSGASLNNYFYIPYKAIKAVAPTVTKVGTWSVTNAAQPTVAGDIWGVQMTVVNTASGNMVVQAPAGGGISVEANP